MIQTIVRTTNSFAFTILRVVLGVAIFPHGAQKMLGWFGGAGFSAALAHFSHAYGIPAPLMILAIAAEFFGSIGLVLGLLGRVAALGIVSTMLVAMWETYHAFGYFTMNWFGNQKGEGVEYHLLAIAAGLAVLIHGSGAFSIDRLLTAEPKQPQSTSQTAGR
jgi:putative oxidoreductase